MLSEFRASCRVTNFMIYREIHLIVNCVMDLQIASEFCVILPLCTANHSFIHKVFDCLWLRPGMTATHDIPAEYYRLNRRCLICNQMSFVNCFILVPWLDVYPVLLASCSGWIVFWWYISHICMDLNVSNILSWRHTTFISTIMITISLRYAVKSPTGSFSTQMSGTKKIWCLL